MSSKEDTGESQCVPEMSLDNNEYDYILTIIFVVKKVLLQSCRCVVIFCRYLYYLALTKASDA